MAWDKTQPTVATKLRLVPSVVTPNWDALEEGSVPHEKILLAERAGNPVVVADSVNVFSKEDASSGFTELYVQNSNGNVIQLTKGALTPLPAKTGTNGIPGRVYFPNSLCMAWNYVSIPHNANTVCAYGTTFGSVYSVQITVQSASLTHNDVETRIVGSPGVASCTIRNATGVDYFAYILIIGV